MSGPICKGWWLTVVDIFCANPGASASSNTGYIMPASTQGSNMQFVTPPIGPSSTPYQQALATPCPPPPPTNQNSGYSASNVQQNTQRNTVVASPTNLSGGDAANVVYHTLPGKNESPRKYLIMGPGGGYYHQYTS